MIDNSKADIIQKFQEIQKIADTYQSDDVDGLGIFVISIGFMVDDEDHQNLLKALEVPVDDKESNFYSVTCEGSAINILEYCTSLANNSNVHCFLLNHADTYMDSKSDEIKP